MWLYTDLLQTLNGKPLSSVFSTDGTLTSASGASHCWEIIEASKSRDLCGNCIVLGMIEEERTDLFPSSSLKGRQLGPSKES